MKQLAESSIHGHFWFCDDPLLLDDFIILVHGTSNFLWQTKESLSIKCDNSEFTRNITFIFIWHNTIWSANIVFNHNCLIWQGIYLDRWNIVAEMYRYDRLRSEVHSRRSKKGIWVCCNFVFFTFSTNFNMIF